MDRRTTDGHEDKWTDTGQWTERESDCYINLLKLISTNKMYGIKKRNLSVLIAPQGKTRIDDDYDADDDNDMNIQQFLCTIYDHTSRYIIQNLLALSAEQSNQLRGATIC